MIRLSSKSRASLRKGGEEMDSISQNSIEVDVQVNNADALDKLANDMSNI